MTLTFIILVFIGNITDNLCPFEFISDLQHSLVNGTAKTTIMDGQPDELPPLPPKKKKPRRIIGCLSCLEVLPLGPNPIPVIQLGLYGLTIIFGLFVAIPMGILIVSFVLFLLQNHPMTSLKTHLAITLYFFPSYYLRECLIR